MAASSTIDDYTQFHTREPGRRSNPLRPLPADIAQCLAAQAAPVDRAATPRATAVARRNAQLPGFAPLLEELEIAGWSSHRRFLGGNFHDWLLLEGCGVLVTVGQAVGPEPFDPTEAALVGQAAWAAIRAHAYHTRDAGTLLSLASRSLWPIPNAGLQASVAVALLDCAGGHANVAMAGDCLAWTVRAATSEQLAICQPPLGSAADFTYPSQSVQLSLRERLLLVADDPQRRSAKLASSIAASFAQLDAESHRRMLAADAVGLVRRHYERAADEAQSPASIVAVRRR